MIDLHWRRKFKLFLFNHIRIVLFCFAFIIAVTLYVFYFINTGEEGADYSVLTTVTVIGGAVGCLISAIALMIFE